MEEVICSIDFNLIVVDFVRLYGEEYRSQSNIVENFKFAWGNDGQKVAKFPIYLRIWKVGNAPI